MMPATVTTLNPLDKGGTVRLTNGNLTASTPDLGFGSVRSTTNKSMGKWHFELCWTNIASDSENTGFGISDKANGLAGAIGDSLNSIGMYDDGLIFYNNLTVTTTPPPPGTGVVSICEVDVGAKLIWFATTPTAIWNNNASANPATGVGGIDISAIALPFFVMVDQGFDLTVTINFGATPFARTPSAGFSAWDVGVQ